MLEAINPNIVKFMEEHFWVELFKLELQEIELPRKDQLVWQESHFLQELLLKKHKELKAQLIKKWKNDFQSHRKLLIKLKLVNWPSCLHNLMKRIYKLKILEMMATSQLNFKLRNHKLTHLKLVQEIKELMVFLMVLHRLRRQLRWVQLITLEVWEVIVDKKLRTLVKGTKVKDKQTMVKVHQVQMFRTITSHTVEFMEDLKIVKSNHSP